MLINVYCVFGIINYSIYNYGDGNYGTNTVPRIETYAPSDLTPTYYNNTIHSYNITFIDDDGDPLYIYWYVNDTLNTSDDNLTYTFNLTGLFNITANVTDTYNDTTLTWMTLIRIYVFVTNITDTIILPNIVSSGNLMVISVNISSNSNISDVYAYLNAHDDFMFLTETPQNRSVGDLWTTNTTTLNWYLASPNNNRKYDFNVSYLVNETYQGENDNVLITQAEDGNMLLGMIVFIPLFIAIILFGIAWFLPPEKYWALKLTLPVLALFFVFQAYQYGVIAIAEFYDSSALINAIGDNTFIFGMVIFVIIAIIIIQIVYDVFMMFRDKKHKTGGGYNDET